MPSFVKVDDKAVKKYIDQLKTARSENKTDEEKKRLETYKDRLMIKKMKGLDMALKDIDFDVYIEV